MGTPIDNPEQGRGLTNGGRVTRREVLKRGLLGAAGLTVLPGVIAACNSSVTPSPVTTPTPTATPTPVPASPSPTPAPSRQLTVGNSNYDAVDLKGVAAVNAAFTAATGLAVTLNTVDHGAFANPIGNFIGGTPDDTWLWISEYRTRFFAGKGLIAPIDDVWARVSGNFSAGFTPAVTGNDGKVYGIPINFYPWCVFYRKSVWAAKGYAVPTTWTEFLALCARMKKDRLTPIAFGDKDGWPAMGTFDILNLRLNGYDFHMNLMTGKEKWTDPRVTAVFEAWRQLVPFYTNGSPGVTWQQACDALVRKTAGMYFLGLFLTVEVAAVDRSALGDIDFFPFPYFGNAFDAERALDAPVDLLMICTRSPTLQADLENAKAYLEFWARGSTQLLMYQADNGLIPTASDADTSKLDARSQKAVSIVRQAQRITQFMDRDTNPAMAGTNGMQYFLLEFLQKPGQDLHGLQQSMQAFWDGLPVYGG